MGVAFLHSVSAGVVVVVVFLVYQQIENHVLYPLIISRTVLLNPLWVLLAVLAGAEIGGIVGSTFGGLCGALLAVPAAGVVQVVAHAWLELRLPGYTGGSKLFGFWEILVYLGFVAVGLFYVWKKGILDWSNDKADL